MESHPERGLFLGYPKRGRWLQSFGRQTRPTGQNKARRNRSWLEFTPLRDNHIPPRPRLVSPFLPLERNRYGGTDIRSETARIASTISHRLLETKSGTVLPTTV